MSKFRPPASAFASRTDFARGASVGPNVLNSPPALQEQSGPVAYSAFSSELTARDNPFRRLILLFGCAYIFVLVSFLHEVLIIRYGLALYLPILTGVPTVLGYIFTGGFRRSFSYRPVLIYICFALWLFPAVFFSAWPGGSTPLMLGFLRTQWVPMFIISGLVTTWKELRLVFYAIVAAGLVNELTAQFMSSDGGTGRLELDIVTLGNSNDVAAQLVMLIPFFWAVSGFRKFPFILRYSMIPLMAFALIVIFRTGSRGALLAMVCGYAFTVIRARGIQRVIVLLAVPAFLVGTLLFTPAAAIQRLSTLLNDQDTSSEAVQSSEGRKEVLKKAIQVTKDHPLFGVGPGQFGDVAATTARARGELAYKFVQHNSYLQVTSEAGIPALLLMLLALYLSYRAALRVMRQARIHRHPEIERSAFAVMAAIICFSVAAFFLTLSFRFYFPMLIGLAVTLERVGMNEFAQLRQPASAAYAGPRPPGLNYLRSSTSLNKRS